MTNKPVYIIAEAGVNHNGNIELAKKLITKGAEAGVDAVKFQTFKAETLLTKKAKKAKYQIQNTGNTDDSQFEMIKKLELDYGVHKELKEFAESHGVDFLSSAFDLDSIDLLSELGMRFFKIPSGEITNYPYLVKTAQQGKDILLSTGMSNLSDIEKALEVLNNNGATKVSVLHCNTEYPTPMQDVNLLSMDTIKTAFNIEVGYSDHTLGIEVPIAAVALGAKIIEKHFTLDKNMEGPDHKASLEPDELKEMVNGIRNIEKALGSSVKKPTQSESKNIEIARKSLVAKTSIKKGETFTVNNLSVKRPGNGISPMEWENFIGKIAIKDYEEDELIIR